MIVQGSRRVGVAARVSCGVDIQFYGGIHEEGVELHLLLNKLECLSL